MSEYEQAQMSYEWVKAAERGVIVDVGQIPKLWVGRLRRAAQRGLIAKWRGFWFPEPGALYGMGPLKTCYGPTWADPTLLEGNQ